MFKSNKLKIEFHYSYLIMALGFILTGYYLNLIVLTSLILIHEMGHYLAATFFSFHVDKIVIYPYGGVTKINDLINRDINQELLIAMSGVITQFIMYLIIVILHNKYLIRDYTMDLYTLYNNQIIFFNLLPIIPLDGSKIINLLLSKYLYYRLSNILSVIISIITIISIILLDIYHCNYSNIMIFSVLFTYLYQFIINSKYLYRKFLLERYLYSISYPNICVIKNYKKMYKNKSHLFFTHHGYIKEKRVLENLFKV